VGVDASAAELIRLISDAFDRRGWRDTGTAAYEAAYALRQGLGSNAAAGRLPSAFLAQNSITRDDVAGLLASIPTTPRPLTPLATEPGAIRTKAVREARVPLSVKPSSRELLLPRIRAAAAGVVAVAGSAVVLAAPPLSGQPWIQTHQNLYALQGLAEIGVLLLATSLFTGRLRYLIAIGPVVIVFVGLLGGPTPSAPTTPTPTPIQT
jgi:hypothetical protein